MTENNLIRVIKRAERERAVPQAACVADAEPSAREQARAVVETVRQWIGESRQTRETWHREGRRQLGWPEDAGNSPEDELVRASREGEE